jgi:hypothetical protein
VWEQRPMLTLVANPLFDETGEVVAH